MSRQEVYSWAALLSNLAFLLFYIVFVFGIPTMLEPYGGDLTRLLTYLILVDVAVQVVIGLQRRSGLAVEKDERDVQIEARGFKVGYHVFLVSIVILIGHLFVVGFLEPFADPDYLEIMKRLPLHYLVLTMIAGTSAKSVVQLMHYRRGT